MTYRTLLGIPFRVRSPSHFEIDGSAYPSQFIDLCVVSFSGHYWNIDVWMKDGRHHYRGPYLARDEAIAALAPPNEGRAA